MQIINEKETILHKPLQKIAVITPEIANIIKEMKKTMAEANGVGLAANQVGLDMQIFVIQDEVAKSNNVSDVYINPEIVEFSTENGSMEEGCLSVPDYWSVIDRPKKIKIKALDENGKKIKIKARGFLARILQHEYDHLNGILIKDRSEK